MTPELWQRVRQAYGRISALSAEERANALAEMRTADPETAPHVERMLTPNTHSDGFLDPLLSQPKSGRQSLPTGKVLAQRFEIRSMLGWGGAGEVYRVFDRLRQREVAMKVLRDGPLGDGGRDALRAELNTATLISHPNVCRLFDITVPDEAGQPAFISMELLEGETLEARLKRGRVSPYEARLILTQTIAGLSAAHACDVVHRDLKPGNIMLVQKDGSLRVVLMDFGLARATKPGDDYRTMFSTQEIVGTPQYMAPEQLEGKRATVQSDLHALGVVMFEMITGALPFDGCTPIVAASARLNNDAPRPRSISKDVDPSWEHAILRCLDRDPLKRPATALAVLALVDGSPPRKWPMPAAFAMSLAILSCSAYLLFHTHHINPQAQIEVDSARVAIENSSEEGFRAAIEAYKRATALDPDWAEPWAELAYAYAAAANGRYLEGTPTPSLAREAAQRAVRLNSRLGKAHAALAWTQSLDFDEFPKAEEQFRIALKQQPKDGQIQYWFGVYLRKRGRYDEAESRDQEALVDSRQRDANVWTELAFLYWTSNQLGKMRVHMNRQLQAIPNYNMTRYLNARLLKLEGKYPEAEEQLKLAEILGLKAATVKVERASLLAASGDFVKARQLVAELEEQGKIQQIDGLLLAGVYVDLNDYDTAIARLEDAWRKRDNTLLSIATSPAVAPLRGRPQFRDLLERLHFP